MTDELRSLLRRVEAAGGPVEVNASGEVAFAQLGPRCEVTLDLEADSREQPRNDALLIHALRLDVIGRGAEFGLSFSRGEQEYKAVVILRDGTTREADDDSAAVAMARAWLAAFEESEK